MTQDVVTYPMHVGMWGLAAIVIVVISWVIYKYLAPDSWREWAQVGVLQAFVIAFYAEMYGFPLTIYFLARFFGVDMAWSEGGNLWMHLFGTPVAHIVAMILGYGIAFAGASLVAEGWRSIHRARQEGELVVSGVYAKVRHPQYSGLFLILLGEGIVHWPTITSVMAFPIIVGAYTLLARKEERKVLEEFGDRYRVYMDTVPMFIPRFGTNPGGMT